MESTPQQNNEGLIVVRVLGAVLEKLVAANANLAKVDPGQVTKFHALKAPAIGIVQYLERIHKYASCSTECFILALIYIDRLIQANNFLLTELNVHRVAITSILLAAKFFDDAYYNNAYYAKVGGVLISEMNRLEVEFLFRINFSLHVSPDLYNKYHEELNAHAPGNILKKEPEVFVQIPDMPKTNYNNALLGINHEDKNYCPPTLFQVPNLKQNEEKCYVSSQPYQETKQYVAGIPIQITPSPTPPPQHQSSLICSRNTYYTHQPAIDHTIPGVWTKNQKTGTIKEPIGMIYSDNYNQTKRPCNVMQNDCSMIIQPMQSHLWRHQSDNLNSINTTIPSRNDIISHHIHPTFNNSKYTERSSSLFVDYTNYCEKGPVAHTNARTNAVINEHELIRHQRRSTSTVAAGTAMGYGRRW